MSSIGDTELLAAMEDPSFEEVLDNDAERFAEEKLYSSLEQFPNSGRGRAQSNDSRARQTFNNFKDAKLYCSSCGHFVTFGQRGLNVLCGECSSLVTTGLLQHTEVRQLISRIHKLEDEVKCLKLRDSHR